MRHHQSPIPKADAPQNSPLQCSAFDNTANSRPAPAFQLKSNPPIQRAIDPNQAESSANGDYLIPNADRRTLYSRQGAPDPVPASLYTRGDDETAGANPVDLHSWRPNVRLFSNDEKATAETSRTRPVPSTGFCGLAGCLGFEETVPQHDLENGMIAEMQGRITGANGDPTTGVIGKNDCGEFANHLQHLIGAGADAPHNLPPANANDTRVGDKMKHNLTDPDDCPYHYATIVAADGNSKVTLEANAGFDLTAPEFFIRDGIQGFMNANNVDYDNGNNYENTRLEAQTAQEHQGSLNRQGLEVNPEEKTTYRTTSGRRISDTVAGL